MAHAQHLGFYAHTQDIHAACERVHGEGEGEGEGERERERGEGGG